MSNQRTLEAAFVLHRRPYSDSSLLIEVISPEVGRRPLIAKGARGARRRTVQLQPFVPLWLGWSGRGELASLNAAESRGAGFMLNGTRLYCGLYVNELIMRLVPRGEALDGLFADYERVLARLAFEDGPEAPLRTFELQLLEHLGYGLMLTSDEDGGGIESDAWYQYHPLRGPRKLAQSADSAVKGSTLHAMAQGDYSDAEVRAQSLRMMRRIIDHYLDHKALKSRALFATPF